MLDEPAGDPTPIAPPTPRPPVEARPTKLSVTKIGTWMINPYEIYARYILRLKKLDDLAQDVDAAERGTMLHAALEDFIRAYPTRLPDDALDQLLTIGAKHFAAHDDHPQVKAIWWPRFKRVAAWFVHVERARRAGGTINLAVEAEGSVLLDGFTLNGRADRIDKLADGSLSLIDYKSGEKPRDNRVKLGLEPQLPLLALIASRGGFAQDHIPAAVAGELAYWKISGGKDGDDDAVSGDIAGLVQDAEAGLTALIAAYADSSMPYLAAPRPGLVSRYDDYAHLARRAEWGHLTGGDE
jgi:ATP-dependent helicase/nuclease subunit B